MALRPSDFRGFALDAAARSMVREYNRRLRPFGLSYVPYFVLLLLSAESTEGVRPSDLAAELRLDNSSLSGHLDRLEASGLLERRVDVADRRVIRVRLTDGGRALARTVEPIGRALSEIDADLSAEALGRVERAVQTTAAGTAVAAERSGGLRTRTGVVTTLRLSTLTVPRSTVGRVLTRFAALVEERSGGAIRVALELPSAAKGGELQTLVDLRSGDIALASITTPVCGNLIPDAQLIELPYLLESFAQADAFLDGPFGARVLADAEANGLTGLGFAVNGFRWLTTRECAARAPAQLAGQRLRVQQSPINVHFAEALRAVAVPLPFGQLADALSACEIDAQENALANIAGLELWRSQRFLIDTQHAISAHVLLANAEILASLGTGADLVRNAMRDAIDGARCDASTLEAALRDELARRMTSIELTDAERSRFAAAAQIVHERMSRAVGDDAVSRAVTFAHAARAPMTSPEHHPQPALV